MDSSSGPRDQGSWDGVGHISGRMVPIMLANLPSGAQWLQRQGSTQNSVSR